jgi:hypothetical protein
LGQRPPDLSTAAVNGISVRSRVAIGASPPTGRKTATGVQQAEKQRMANFYARTTKKQEERENAEARERFLEQQQRLTVNRPIKP